MVTNANRYNRSVKSPPTLAFAAAMLLTGEQAFAAGLVLEETIVTAQKREQSLQDTPIAVSAFTAGAIQSKGIENISEVAYFIWKRRVLIMYSCPYSYLPPIFRQASRRRLTTSLL